MTSTPPLLRDYQLHDVNTYLDQLTAGRRAIFSHHEQGLGKSLIALTVYREWGARCGRAPRLLIAGPSISRVSWETEIRKWARDLWPSTVVINKSADVHKVRADTSVVIVTYDLARRPSVRDPLRDWATRAFVVLDEYQYLRNPDAKRTQAFYALHDRSGILTYADRVMLMSGTPQVSWPQDLWASVSRFEWDRLRDEDGRVMGRYEFRDRYHHVVERAIPGTRKTRPHIVRAQNLDDLARRLDGMAIRRTKTEVDLPPLTWQMWPIELEPSDRKAMDKALEDGLPDHVRDALAKAAVNPSEETEAEAARLLAAHQESISVMIRILGAAKANAVARALNDELENSDRPIGIGCWNTDVMDVFDAELSAYGVVRIDGATTPSARRRAVEWFQDPSGPRVFNGQISACGTALTLTRASDVVMPQLSWTPGENAQFASRFHRIGQHLPVTVRMPFVAGTLDEAVTTVLEKKMAAASAVVDHQQQQETA